MFRLLTSKAKMSYATFLVVIAVFGLCFSCYLASGSAVAAGNIAGSLEVNSQFPATVTASSYEERAFPIHHSLARLPNGSLCAIFASNKIEPTTGNAVYITSSADNGVSWNQPIKVSTQQSNTLGYAIAADANNNVYVAWTGIGIGGLTWQLYCSKYDGSVWNAPVQISKGLEPMLHAHSVDICVDENNNVHLVWDTSRNGNSTHDYLRNQIYYAKYDGTSWSMPALISSHVSMTPFFQLNPAIAVDSQNNLHVVWEGSNYPSTEGTIWYVKYDRAWYSPVALATSNIPSTYVMYLQAPVIAVDSNDILHIAWQGAASLEARTNQIWYMKQGRSPSQPIVISQVPLSDTSDQEQPSITVDSANRIHVLWMSTRESLLYYTRYSPTTSWSTPIQIEGKNALYPNFASMPYDTGATVEIDYTFYRDSTLMFNRLSSDTLPSGPAFFVTVSPASEVVGVEQPLRLTSAVTAGTPPYSYKWYLNGTAVEGANKSTWTFEASTTGTYLVTLAVTDAGNNIVYSEPAKVKVTIDYVKGFFGCLELGNEGNGFNAYSAFGSKYTLNVEANITSMSGYLSTWTGPQYPATFSYRYAIYTDNNGYVGNLIGQTNIATRNASGYTRLCISYFSSPIHLNPGTYWLMGVMDSSAGGTASCIQTNDYNQSVTFYTDGMGFPSTADGQPWFGKLFCVYASWELNGPAMPTDVFSVSSNSTVSSLVYDGDKNQLSFTVTGPSGTVGYADIYVSKSMIGNPWELTVLLDGARLNFTSTSIDDVWVLHFVYSHSTHEVTIDMATSSNDNYSIIAEFTHPILGFSAVIIITLSILIVNKKRFGVTLSKRF